MTSSPLFLAVVLIAGPAAAGAMPAQDVSTQTGSAAAAAAGSGPTTGAVAGTTDAGAGDDQAADSGDAGVSVERVQRALSRPPAIRLDAGRQVFRVEVLGPKLTIEDILGPDYLKGPVPGGGMTHQEFLDMVTPKAYQGYAPFTNGEALTVAVTSFIQKWALQKAIHKFQTATEERGRDAARREVEEALADLDRARARAGLPPR